MRIIKQTCIFLLITNILYISTASEKQTPIKLSQEKVNVSALILTRLKDASFTIYTPPVQAKGVYGKIQQATCLTPETLIMSMESETNQKWVDYNYFPGKAHKVTKKQFIYRRSMDKNTNYLELQSKLLFTYDGRPSAIIKYYSIENNKKTILSFAFLQKNGKRWYCNAIPMDLLHLGTIVKRVKPDLLKIFFEGNISPTASDYIKQLSKKVRPSWILNIELLYDEMMILIKKKDWNTFLFFCDKSYPER